MMPPPGPLIVLHMTLCIVQEFFMLDLIKQRRSIRVFTAEPVSEADTHQLLTAALLGPTAKGRKPLEYVVVRNKQTIAALKACKAAGSLPDTTPLIIAILADTKVSDVWVEDASIAALLIHMQAEHMGLGCTWIQMRKRQSVAGGDSEAAVREVLGIPAQYGVLALMAIGHKGEHKTPYTDADADFGKVHTERF